MRDSTTRPPDGLLVERYDRGDYVKHQPNHREFWRQVESEREERRQQQAVKRRKLSAAELNARQRAVSAAFTGRKQDDEGWITPEFDAWCREHNPEAYGGLPTVTEFRSELRELERDHSAEATATTTLSAAEIVARQMGAA